MTKSKTSKSTLQPESEIDISGIVTKDDLRNIPRGQPKSGRPWKTTREHRYSEINKVKSLKSSWQKKVDERDLKKAVKLREKEMRAERAQALEDKRKRQDENKKRRLENEKKSELVQVIKNPAKIKRMKKRQLRMIEKR